MNRRIPVSILWAFLAVCAFTPFTRAHALRPDALRQTLQALYDAADAAQMRKDADGCYSICAPDCIWLHGQRKHTLKYLKTGWSKNFAMCDQIKARTLILDLKRTSADSAIVTVDCMDYYHLHDPSGRPHVSTSRFVERDNWQRRNGRWLIVRCTWISGGSLMDGRPEDSR